jgi:hypothetical protein
MRIDNGFGKAPILGNTEKLTWFSGQTTFGSGREWTDDNLLTWNEHNNLIEMTRAEGEFDVTGVCELYDTKTIFLDQMVSF